MKSLGLLKNLSSKIEIQLSAVACRGLVMPDDCLVSPYQL